MHVRRFGILFLALAASMPVVRADLTVEPAAIDLGRWRQERVATAEVRLTNSGTDPVGIARTHASCSCTVTSLDRNTLGPGESMPLRISVETRHYVGPMQRFVYLETTSGVVTIPIKIDVELYEHWNIEPSVIMLPPASPGQEASMRATLLYTGPGKADLGTVDSSATWLTAKVRSDDGRRFEMDITRHPDAPAGDHTVTVTVSTSDPADPQLSLTVFVPMKTPSPDASPRAAEPGSLPVPNATTGYPDAGK